VEKNPETFGVDANKLLSQDSIFGGAIDQSKVDQNQLEEVI